MGEVSVNAKAQRREGKTFYKESRNGGSQERRWFCRECGYDPPGRQEEKRTDAMIQRLPFSELDFLAIWRRLEIRQAAIFIYQDYEIGKSNLRL